MGERHPEVSLRRRELLVCAAHGIEAELLRASLAAHRREAASWLALASPEQPPPASVERGEATRDLGILLAGEAANHRCKAVLHVLEPVTVQADPGALRLALLRAFLAALSQGRGGTVLIEVRGEPGQGLVSLTPKPGPGVLSYAPRPITVTAPDL